MGKYRLSANTTSHYSSIEELVASYGKEMKKKRTNDQTKLKVQKEKFLGKCKCCGESMEHLSGTNILTCSNKKCHGYKVSHSDGTFHYEPFVRILDERGYEIATTLFD